MSKIAFQGEFGANSHFAAKDVYPHMEPIPCATFEDAFASLKSGEADLAMIPIENSLAGRVADIHHLLPNSGLHIIGEYFLPIHFQLMVLPGVTIDEVTDVHSHVHAIGQCRKIVREHGWTAHIAGDTAGAAKMVAEEKVRTNAAFAPYIAAELYGLDIIAENVEDADYNTTRFVILAREPQTPAANNGPTVMSFVFRVRNVPAALYKAMGGFATNGVNMTKLESYQMGGKFYASQFYAEIDGHPEDKSVINAMEELRFFAEVDMLGVYPASEFRQKIINLSNLDD